MWAAGGCVQVVHFSQALLLSLYLAILVICICICKLQMYLYLCVSFFVSLSVRLSDCLSVCKLSDMGMGAWVLP